MGRSYSKLLRQPFFAYSKLLELASYGQSLLKVDSENSTSQERAPSAVTSS